MVIEDHTFESELLARDWVAVMAMQGLLGNSEFLKSFIPGTDKTPEDIAKKAYQIADAMLKQSQESEQSG